MSSFKNFSRKSLSGRGYASNRAGSLQGFVHSLPNKINHQTPVYTSGFTHLRLKSAHTSEISDAGNTTVVAAETALYPKAKLIEINKALVHPKVWGSSLWRSLHTMAACAPESLDDDEQTAFRNLIEGLVFTLPCSACKINLDTKLEKKELTLEDLATRKGLSKFLFETHNKVNEDTGKSTMSAVEFTNTYGVEIL